MPILLRNIMETLALQKLDESIDKLGCCKCAQCRMDIVSYALNRLPAQYVATREDEIYSKLVALSTQHDLAILSALIQGAEIVKHHTCHTPDDIEEMLAAQQLSDQNALTQAEELESYKDPMDLEKQSLAELSAPETVDMLDFSSIGLSDLPADLSNMDEILKLLGPIDFQLERVEK